MSTTAPASSSTACTSSPTVRWNGRSGAIAGSAPSRSSRAGTASSFERLSCWSTVSTTGTTTSSDQPLI